MSKNLFFLMNVYLESYSPVAPDVWSGLSNDANARSNFHFFTSWRSFLRNYLCNCTQNQCIQCPGGLSLERQSVEQAQRFVNDVNQSISADQQDFAEQQVVFAQTRLTTASDALEAFQDRYGQLNPSEEQSATTRFITGLESRLVDLKVEEASLRRQYRDPDAPEVAYVADQVAELERQIQDEREKAVGSGGRDLNKLVNQSERLEADVTFARDALASAMRAAR